MRQRLRFSLHPGYLGRHPARAGAGLIEALLASDNLRAAFDQALREAEAAHQPLRVELRGLLVEEAVDGKLVVAVPPDLRQELREALS